MAAEERKISQPFRPGLNQTWASNVLEGSHNEALYAFGELCLFTMMWRPADFDAGLVTRCSTCFGGTKARQAQAFKQPTTRECPDCFGTTFEGGFRAQIIRPTLFADRNSELSEEARGYVVSDTLQVESTADFTLHKGDFIFRFDNTRWQVEEKREAVVRPGFGPPLSIDSFGGSTTAHMEEKTSTAFRIPPTSPEAVRLLLAQAGDTFTIDDITAMDVIQTGGYILEGQAQRVADPSWPPGA